MGQLFLPEISPDAEIQRQLHEQVTPNSTFKKSYDFDVLEGFTGSAVRVGALQGASDSGVKLTTEELNQRYPGKAVRWDSLSVSGIQADIIHNRKMEELERKDLWNRAEGWGTTASVFGSLSAGLVDPLGLVLGAVIMPSRMMPLLAGARAMSAVGQPVGQRLAGTAATNIVDAIAGNALLEPGILYANQRYNEDYTSLDSLTNVVVGGLVGGLIPAAAVGVAHGFSATRKVLPNWLYGKSVVAHETAVNQAVGDVLAGRQPQVEPIIFSAKEAETVSAVKVAQEKVQTAQQQSDAKIEQISELHLNMKRAMEKASSEQKVALKKEFDASVEMSLYDAKHVEIRGNDVILNGKKISYDMEGIHFQGKPFRKLEKLNYAWKVADGANPLKSKSSKLASMTKTHSRLGEVQASYGSIIEEPDGRIWVFHPKGQYGGYTTSFPKGGANGGETIYGAAVREVFEETGMVASPHHSLGDFERTGSVTQYFVAKRMDGSPQGHGSEAEGVSLHWPQNLLEKLQAEGNLNDAKVLESYINYVAQRDLEKHIPAEVKKNIYTIPKELDDQLGGLRMKTALQSEYFQNDILDLHDFIEVYGQKGSNPGGVYRAPNGDHYYVKFPPSEAHVHNEQAAGNLYRLYDELAGTNFAVTTHVAKDGDRIGVASKIIENLEAVSPEQLSHMFNTTKDMAFKNQIQQLANSWKFDAFMANYDVYGTGPTWNVMVDTHAGTIHKIDYGGAMRFRAQGGEKGGWGAKVSEIDTMPQHGAKPMVYLNAESQEARESLFAIAQITKEHIASALKSTGMSGEELKKQISVLLARKHEMKAHAPQIAKEAAESLGEVSLFTQKEGIDHVLEKGKLHVGKYTEDERFAMKHYQEGSSVLNNYLWNNKELNSENIKLVHNLDKAAQKGLLEEQTLLYSWNHASDIGLDKAPLSSYLGKYHHTLGYISSSVGPDNGFHTKSMLLIIEAPPGTKGFFQAANDKNTHKGTSYITEQEFTLGRNQYLRIDSVEMLQFKKSATKSAGKYQVHATLVTKHFEDLDFIKQHTNYLMEQAKLQKSSAISDILSMDNPEAEAQLKSLVEKVYAAQHQEVPTLTDVVTKETPLMTQLAEEIKNLEASIKLDEKNPAHIEHIAAMKEVNAGIKQGDEMSQAIYQAWTCYKGA